MNASTASAPIIYGRNTVRVGNSKMNYQGKIDGRTLCLGEFCVGKSELTNWKDKTMPIDCIAGNWEEWAGCTKTCGGGVQYRWRNVIQPPKNDGNPCPYLS